jgi:hypothetical protein
MKQHPLSAAFPSMSDVEIEALAQDIRANGQHEPGVIFEGMVLDGWHRFLACQSAGVDFKTVDFDPESDPVSFVKSRNLHRRHLTESQRAAAVVACSVWAPRGRQTGNVAHLTNAEMAREADVSPRTIKDAKAAHAAGFTDAVRDGAISVNQAAKLARDPDQGEPVRKVPAHEDEADRLRERVAELEAANEELRDNLADAVADNESMAKSFEADDKLAAAMKELGKVRAENRTLKVRVNGLLAEKNEAVRAAKSWQRKAEARAVH